MTSNKGMIKLWIFRRNGISILSFFWSPLDFQNLVEQETKRPHEAVTALSNDLAALDLNIHKESSNTMNRAKTTLISISKNSIHPRIKQYANLSGLVTDHKPNSTIENQRIKSGLLLLYWENEISPLLTMQVAIILWIVFLLLFFPGKIIIKTVWIKETKLSKATYPMICFALIKIPFCLSFPSHSSFIPIFYRHYWSSQQCWTFSLSVLGMGYPIWPITDPFL